MLRNLMALALVSFLFTSCSSTSIQRGLANTNYGYGNNDKVYLSGLKTYFPINSNYQLVTLHNKYSVDIKYKIVSLGNIMLVNDKGTCQVSGANGAYTVLPSNSQCTFTILTEKNKNINEGEIRIYKKSDDEQELIISEIIYLNTFNKIQCETLIKHAYKAQNPETLHADQYNIINNKYVYKPEFITDCRLMLSSKVDNHNKVNLLKYCINNYDPGKKKPFNNNEKSYLDHLNDIADFDPENYCQYIDD